MVAAALLLGVMLLTCSSGQELPKLVVDGSVAGDFQALALETWDRFLVAFQGRTGCFGDVRLRAVSSLDGRAGYDPDTATVTVQVPGTPAMLRGALIHEWAHHVEFQCEAHRQLRAPFLAAQGLPPDLPWRPDVPPAEIPASMWPDIPSEQYAEATIVLLLGRRPIMTGVSVSPEAVGVVGAWAAGN